MGNNTSDQPKKSPKKKKPNDKKKANIKPKHQYFTAHPCYLPPEKVNAYQITCGTCRSCILYLTSVHLGDIRASNLYRSYSALCEEKYRQWKHYPYSIHPYSRIRVWFEMGVILSLLYNNFITAIDVVQPFYFRWTFTICKILLMLSEITYIVNVIMNFFTGYIEGKTQQKVILDLKKISWHYLKTWLITDLISLICCVPLIYDPQFSSPAWYIVMASTLLLRIPILMKYLNNMLTVTKIRIFGKTLFEIFILILLYLCWNIYFQFSVEFIKERQFTPSNPDNCSWITMAKLWSNVTSGVKFAYSLDRAVGMLRKNANINLVEKMGCFETFFIIAWIIAKLLVYHCVFKYIVSLFGRESAKAKYFIMTKQVSTLMKQRKFPPRIREKLLKFYAIRFQSHYFAENKMLSCVTGQLREDIIMHTGRQLVGELEFLKQLPRSLLLQIGLKLKIVIFIAGDIICKINTAGDCLYFIDKGTVAIYSESGNEICHLEDGDYFGEIALVMKHKIRTASVVAVTNCELFRLDKEDFDSSIACYPTVYENIKKVAIDRYERTCLLDEHHKAELKIAEDHVLKDFTDENSERGFGSEDHD